MLFHTVCKTCSVKLDLSGTYKFLSEFGVNTRGVRPTMGDIVQTPEVNPVAQYFCTTCHKVVPMEELEVYCGQCCTMQPLLSMFRPSRSGGYYCSKCIKVFEQNGETAIPIHKLMGKLQLKEGD